MRFFRSAASKTMRAFVLERAAAGGEIRRGKRRGRAGFSRRIAKGCGQEFLRVGMTRFFGEAGAGQDLHDFPLIEDHHALAKIPHQRQIVGDEEIRHAPLSLEAA
mgnify:CR=1 FL=1